MWMNSPPAFAGMLPRHHQPGLEVSTPSAGLRSAGPLTQLNPSCSTCKAWILPLGISTTLPATFHPGARCKILCQQLLPKPLHLFLQPGWAPSQPKTATQNVTFGSRELPKIRGRNTGLKIVGLLLQGYPRHGPPNFRNSRIVLMRISSKPASYHPLTPPSKEPYNSLLKDPQSQGARKFLLRTPNLQKHANSTLT